MISITSANYEDPHQSPNCSLLLRVACEPNPATGESALDNAQAFVERAKLLAETPLAVGRLALDSDGHLLSQATLQHLLRAAEQRGAASVKQRLPKKPPRKASKPRKAGRRR